MGGLNARRLPVKTLASLPIAVLAIGLVAGSLQAQIAEPDGGGRIEGELNFSLQLDDDVPEFRTNFDLDVISATRTQRLSFSGDIGATVPLDAVEDAGLSDPRYGIDYLRDTGRSRIALSAFFQRSDVDGTGFDTDNPETSFDESALTVNDDGTRERRDLSAEVAFGMEDPIGGEFRYSRTETLYTNTTDPSLTDTLIDQVVGGLHFDAGPALSYTVDAQWRMTTEEDPLATEEERIVVGGGVRYTPWDELELSADLAYAQITQWSTIGGTRQSADRNGLNVSFDANYDRPNGDYSLEFSHLLNAPGFVDTLTLTRQLELPRGAQIGTSVGAVRLPSDDVHGTAGFSYDRDTRTGSIQLAIDRMALVNGDDFEVLRHILSAGYAHELPRGGSLNASARLVDSEFTLDEAPDVAASLLSLRYARPLTEDWNFSAGLTLNVSREDGADETQSGTVSVTLNRGFQVRW